jgi:hypothetical protein
VFKAFKLLDSSLNVVQTYSKPDSNLPVVREIQEFPEVPSPEPFTEYVNNIYVYPQNVTMNAKGKNIGVRVQLRKDDSVEGHQGLKCVYGKHQKLVNSAITSITCKNKQPDYHEEIKIQLPASLNGQHHLFFTFFNVNTKNKKGEDEMESIVGYAFLPLYQNGKVVGDEHALPVCSPRKDENKPYLNSDDLQYYDGGKPLFHCRIKLVSSVYSQDEHLNNFFRMSRVKDLSSPETEKKLLDVRD